MNDFDKKICKILSRKALRMQALQILANPGIPTRFYVEITSINRPDLEQYACVHSSVQWRLRTLTPQIGGQLCL